MEQACAKIADVSLKLKRQYQVLLGASPGYGVDKQLTKEIDVLGLLIKELEDSIVILQITLDGQSNVHAPIHSLAPSTEE